jgi:dTDP-4-dehydrorhamnose reductase
VKLLVLGASGMLGNAVMRFLADTSPRLEVFGTVRAQSLPGSPMKIPGKRILAGIDVARHESLVQAMVEIRPDVVINCVGLVKQLAKADDPLLMLPINALLPHRLSALCELAGARLIHISTDCVFAGTRGGYRETDIPDATDLYGRSKHMGEVCANHVVTLRTSIIGHELASGHGLVSWFLSQEESVRGYARAVFSGLPTVELARVIRDFIIPSTTLSGLYHVASKSITKYELLNLISKVYGKEIRIDPDDSVVVDRSLNSQKFNEAVGYVAPEWPELISRMYRFQ